MKASDWLPQVILDLNAEYKKAVKKAKPEDRAMVETLYDEKRKELYRGMLGAVSDDYPKCEESRARKMRI